MKRFIYILLAAITTYAIAMSCQVAAHNLPQRDWKRDMALTANDLPAFLKYHPTDGASYAGHVRTSMKLTQVQP